jgi:hypothetical protein
MMQYMIVLAVYDSETDSMEYIESVETEKCFAEEAFEQARATINSFECNHDQLDRNEGIE